MSDSLSRQQIMDALRAAKVPFDEEATMVQLRQLFDEMVKTVVVGPANVDVADEKQQQSTEEKGAEDLVVFEADDGGQGVDSDDELSAILNHPILQKSGAVAKQAAVNVPLSPPSLLQSEQEVERLLDKQLAIAYKRRELLQLQRELGQENPKRIDLPVLDAMMVKFDGSELQDVVKWLVDLENVFALFAYSERDKLVAARHLLSGYAKRYIEISVIRCYGDLKRSLLREFERRYTVQDVFKQLKMRVIQPQETPRQYVI